MESKLLEIKPGELKFVFELKKQSSCSIQLVNKTHQHVAFKVKTTSPRKYCVRPNVGIVMPKSACEFTVTMQAQRSAPPDMMCKDKFLIQSTVVPAGTADEDITPELFSKEEGKFVEENKLRVSLISPPVSPVLSPINEALKQGIIEPLPMRNHRGLFQVDFGKPEPVVPKAASPPKLVNGEQSPTADVKIKSAKEITVTKDAKVVEPYQKDINLCSKDNVAQMNQVEEKAERMKAKVVEPYVENINLCVKDEMKDMHLDEDVSERMNLIEGIAEIKTKLSELEAKIHKAEATIYDLTEARNLSNQEKDKLKEELALLKSRSGRKTVHDGFPLLFVVMVALISLTFGYLS
ncbi:hypothetical protein SAY87_026992 [Trapa incisa]|uniref:MSP domain-containing protein n=1 Tax=Trapa incisa TaxID=236973 RepID=A0AAN7JMF7_9MYRT|nr:hypothetical protein SAY87_026992 [Trapa incisa]